MGPSRCLLIKVYELALSSITGKTKKNRRNLSMADFPVHLHDFLYIWKYMAASQKNFQLIVPDLNFKILIIFPMNVFSIFCSDFKKLQSLELCGGSITDAGVKNIKDLTSMMSLNLSQNSHLTDGALEFILGISLSSLNLHYCDQHLHSFIFKLTT